LSATTEWLSRKEAAIYLKRLGCPIAPKTLENLASNNNAGCGPPFTRIGWKCVRYLRTDLDAWASRRMVRVA
jgi:hypothetical protein